MDCKCNMRERMAGDGCESCNPKLAIDMLSERLKDMQAQRDELLAALKDVLKWARPIAGDNQDEEAAALELQSIDEADIAIIKAEQS